ncbi:hypothetical protein DRF65_14950 [Chryseobacterium pennae]|uniref:Uncharacterized protein n=1 Tax=Chryseobacterium pennae TaxID=2258962 RepID=A0A3D9C711_9FLAO|nr:hypothetical protein [Chryseobacterium pennae]REC61488.1 hypothetical protein DRF65_14950 [Chryseobacterium pennae]
MKAYYYFLFRIYRYYKDKRNEGEFEALFSVAAVSSVILSFHLIGVYIITNYFDLVSVITNKVYMILFMIIVGCVNYYFFVRDKKFLNYGFQKDRKGGIYIIIYIFFLGISLIIVSNINREKIFEERRKNPTIENTGNRKSLIGDIVKWFEENNL